MKPHCVAVIGLPESGKTTYLAALWNTLINDEFGTRLTFGSLEQGDATHLNEIALRWARGERQDHSRVAGDKIVRISLRKNGSESSITFPDLAGESFQQMWESRQAPQHVADTLADGGVLLFVNANRVVSPRWITDNNAYLALSPEEETAEKSDHLPWEASLAPTQVQLVDILSIVREHWRDAAPRNIAVMLSCWDAVIAEEMSPAVFFQTKLPLLYQHLLTNDDYWRSKVYGVSAQGAEYAKPGGKQDESAQRVLSLDRATERISLVDGEQTSHDLTVPLEWLTQYIT